MCSKCFQDNPGLEERCVRSLQLPDGTPGPPCTGCKSDGISVANSPYGAALATKFLADSRSRQDHARGARQDQTPDPRARQADHGRGARQDQTPDPRVRQAGRARRGQAPRASAVVNAGYLGDDALLPGQLPPGQRVTPDNARRLLAAAGGDSTAARGAHPVVAGAAANAGGGSDAPCASPDDACDSSDGGTVPRPGERGHAGHKLDFIGGHDGSLAFEPGMPELIDSDSESEEDGTATATPSEEAIGAMARVSTDGPELVVPVTVVERAQFLVAQSALEHNGCAIASASGRAVMRVSTPGGHFMADLERNAEADVLLPCVVVRDGSGPKLLVVPPSSGDMYDGRPIMRVQIDNGAQITTVPPDRSDVVAQFSSTPGVRIRTAVEGPPAASVGSGRLRICFATRDTGAPPPRAGPSRRGRESPRPCGPYRPARRARSRAPPGCKRADEGRCVSGGRRSSDGRRAGIARAQCCSGVARAAPGA